MKQIILLFLLAFPYCTFAQDSDNTEDDDIAFWKSMEPETFEGRLLAGFNCSQMDGDTYAGFHKAGLNIGGQVYVHFTHRFGVSMELLYSQKGVRGATIKESYTWGTYFDKYYLNLNYAEAALLLHLDRIFLDYEAGISYARLITSHEWADADVPLIFPANYAYFNNYDLSYVGGLSLRFKKRWRVNARYQYSALTIRPRERVMPRYSNGKNQFNECFSFRLVYTL